MTKSKLKARTYDWEKWFSRSLVSARGGGLNLGWIRLSPGRDFNGMAHSFAVVVRRNANSRGHSVQCRVLSDGKIEFKITGRLRRKRTKK